LQGAPAYGHQLEFNLHRSQLAAAFGIPFRVLS
jgi:hypothetical protein